MKQFPVDVFRTNVYDPQNAGLLIEEIQKGFPSCQANFDLEDCDHILRVFCTGDPVSSSQLIGFLNRHGVAAEELEDVVPPRNLRLFAP